MASPASGTFRRLKGLTVRNTSSVASRVTVQHFNGTLAADLFGVLLLPGETLLRAAEARWFHLDVKGGAYPYEAPLKGLLSITGAKAETVPRMLCNEGALTITSGTVYSQVIFLQKGTVVNSISFCSSTTAAGTPTNQIFGLYGTLGNLLGATNNDTTTAWAANTLKTLTMTSPVTIPVSGAYRLAVLVTATTTPSLKSLAGINSTLTSAWCSAWRGNGTTGLTTALPDPMSQSISNGTNILWGCVS